MNIDKTAAERVRRQRKQRLHENWCEVKVWVPTKEDAADVRNLAAVKRSNAEDLTGLSAKIKSVGADMQKEIAVAIMEHGSAAYNTESGAMQELMSKLASEGDFLGFSTAFIIFARAKPTNATYLEGRVPAMISNYLSKRFSGKPSPVFNWQKANPDWSEGLKQVVRNPVQFKKLVERYLEDIKDQA